MVDYDSEYKHGWFLTVMGKVNNFNINQNSNSAVELLFKIFQVMIAAVTVPLFGALWLISDLLAHIYADIFRKKPSAASWRAAYRIARFADFALHLYPNELKLHYQTSKKLVKRVCEEDQRLGEFVVLSHKMTDSQKAEILLLLLGMRNSGLTYSETVITVLFRNKEMFAGMINRLADPQDNLQVLLRMEASRFIEFYEETSNCSRLPESDLRELYNALYIPVLLLCDRFGQNYDYVGSSYSYRCDTLDGAIHMALVRGDNFSSVIAHHRAEIVDRYNSRCSQGGESLPASWVVKIAESWFPEDAVKYFNRSSWRAVAPDYLRLESVRADCSEQLRC